MGSRNKSPFPSPKQIAKHDKRFDKENPGWKMGSLTVLPQWLNRLAAYADRRRMRLLGLAG